MLAVSLRQTFDSGDFHTLDFNRQRHAGVYGKSIKINSTGPTGTSITDQFRSGDVQTITKNLQKCFTWFNINFVCDTVDG